MRRVLTVFCRTGVMSVIAMSLCSIRGFANEPTVFTYRTPESAADARYNYDNAVLRLALEKTKAKWGPYKLVGSAVMNFSRAMEDIKSGTTPNFFLKQSYEAKMREMNIDFAKFDIDRGIVGWRVCFTSKAGIEKLKKVKTLDDLKKVTHGQGLGWADTGILRSQGFTVEEVGSYESLFQMVAKERFDLFCRGANELLEEWEGHKNIEGLVYDKTIAIQYPLPRFFWTNKANKDGIRRIEEGLNLAWKDGSLQKEWLKNYKDSIRFTNLQKRKIFRLENPNLQGLDYDWKPFAYDPVANK
jgi:hypothetical protein